MYMSDGREIFCLRVCLCLWSMVRVTDPKHAQNASQKLSLALFSIDTEQLHPFLLVWWLTWRCVDFLVE